MPLPDTIAHDWDLLLRSHHPSSRFVSFATRGRDGWPKVRLLVVRGFDRERELLWFSTNASSEKMRELEEDNRAQVLAWDGARRVQWRIDCRMRILATDEVAARHPKLSEHPAASVSREELWRQHDEHSCITFHWPEPGLKLSEEVLGAYRGALQAYRAAPDGVPDRFVVLEGVVKAIDRLELSHPFHLRSRFKAGEHWSEEKLTT